MLDLSHSPLKNERNCLPRPSAASGYVTSFIESFDFVLTFMATKKMVIASKGPIVISISAVNKYDRQINSPRIHAKGDIIHTQPMNAITKDVV